MVGHVVNPSTRFEDTMPIRFLTYTGHHWQCVCRHCACAISCDPCVRGKFDNCNTSSDASLDRQSHRCLSRTFRTSAAAASGPVHTLSETRYIGKCCITHAAVCNYWLTNRHNYSQKFHDHTLIPFISMQSIPQTLLSAIYTPFPYNLLKILCVSILQLKKDKTLPQSQLPPPLNYIHRVPKKRKTPNSWL